MFKKKISEAEQQLKNIDAAIGEIQHHMLSIDINDEDFPAYTSALGQLMTIRQGILESRAKCAKDKSTIFDVIVKAASVVGTLAITGIGLKLAFDTDQSDEIIRNKSTLGLVGKLFPPKNKI